MASTFTELDLKESLAIFNGGSGISIQGHALESLSVFLTKIGESSSPV